MSVQSKRERRATLAQEARKLVDNWKADHQARYDEILREIDDIDASIKRDQDLAQREAEDRVEKLGHRDARDLERPDNLTPKAIFSQWLRRGDEGLSDAQRQVVRNTMSTGTGSEGGHTVATEVSNEILGALKEFGGMRAAARILRTSSGNPMNFPTSDGTSEVGELVAENATSTNADPTFGVKALPVYRYSSKDVAVPIELLQDSQADIEAFIRARLVTRLGRITNTHFTTGTGTGQPNGIVTAATGATAATGNVTSFSYDEVLNLVHAVDPAYRRGECAFMMSDAALLALRKLKDSQNRPIFLPGFDSAGIAGMPGRDRLLGYPVVINQDVAVPAANAKSLLFGDWSFYVIRDVMDITMYRFTDSAFAKKGQVGFLAMLRTGGNLVDVGGAIKYRANSAT